jgi:hypothetical protein
MGADPRYGDIRLEKACDRAWQLGARTRRSVDSMLTHNLENLPLPNEERTSPSIHHENLRGKRNYH